jgi:hypothetical protein
VDGNSFDWPATLVAGCRRRDAELLRKFGVLRAPPEASAALLRACKARWANCQFDELNIAIDSIDDQRLFRAVQGVVGEVRVVRRRGYRQLSKPDELRVLRWFLAVRELEIDGLRLHRCLIGWCRVLGWPQ